MKSIQPPGMIDAIFLRVLLEASTRYGVDRAAVLAELDVPETMLAESSAAVPLDVMVRAWTTVPERSGEADFGLLSAETMPPGSYGELEYAVLSSATALEALERAIRFQRVTYAMSDLTFTVSGDLATVQSRSFGIASEASLRHYIEHGFAFIATRVRSLIASAPMPMRVALPHPAPKSTAQHRRLFGDTIHFDQPRATLVYRKADLAQTLASYDPSFLESFSDEEQKISLAAARAATSTKERVRHLLLAFMRQGDASVVTIARTLGQSTRTLQRRLHSEGAPFADLVDAVRAEEAQRYVIEGRLTYGEMAFRLGFSQQSAFFRAFKRWTKATPTEFRAMHRPA